MKNVLIGFGALVLIIGAIFLVKSFAVVDKVTDPDHIIASYEEFQNMYNTCQKICDDISVLKSSNVTSESGFSKEDRMVALKNNLNRWIQEYNSKSRQLTRNKWKNTELPYQLSTEYFNCE